MYSLLLENKFKSEYIRFPISFNTILQEWKYPNIMINRVIPILQFLEYQHKEDCHHPLSAK